MDNKTKWIIITIIISITIIGSFTFFISLSISNITVTHEIKMDDNTREYLIAHDYCFQMQSPRYESNKTTNLFIGDCEYLDTSLFKEN